MNLTAAWLTSWKTRAASVTEDKELLGERARLMRPTTADEL